MAVQPRIYKDWSQAPLMLTTEEARKILRISKPTLLALLTGGKIIAFKAGQQWRIPKESLQRFVSELPTE